MYTYKCLYVDRSVYVYVYVYTYIIPCSEHKLVRCLGQSLPNNFQEPNEELLISSPKMTNLPVRDLCLGALGFSSSLWAAQDVKRKKSTALEHGSSGEATGAEFHPEILQRS